MSKVIFLPFLEPLLAAVIELPQKMGPYLMVEHSFYRELGVSDGQSNNHCAHGLYVVVDDAGVGNCVLNELIVEEVADL